jgi:hypothetical protein
MNGLNMDNAYKFRKLNLNQMLVCLQKHCVKELQIMRACPRYGHYADVELKDTSFLKFMLEPMGNCICLQRKEQAIHGFPAHFGWQSYLLSP